MKKKLLVVLAVVTALGLAGCQNEVSTNAPEATVTVAPTKETEPTKTPELTATTAPTATPEPTAVPEVKPTEVPEVKPTVEPEVEPTAEPTAVPESTKAPIPEPTATATPEPTKAPTQEPTKEPEKSADKNGCSDVITAVDYTSDYGRIVSYDFFGNIREVLAYIHKNGLKFYAGDDSYKAGKAVFGSSLYGEGGNTGSKNTGKYFINYSFNDEPDWYRTIEELAKADSWQSYEFNGIKIAYRIASEEYKYNEELNYIEYMFAQDIGLSSFIFIDVKSYDLTESMDDVLERVLLLEDDYTFEAPAQEPTEEPTPEPTKKPEKLVDKNGCSDVVTAVDYTADEGCVKGNGYVDVIIHKNSGIKFSTPGGDYRTNTAIFGSSLYDKGGYENRPNPCKYFIIYECKGESTDEYTSFEVLDNRLLGYAKHEVYDYNGTKIFVKKTEYEEEEDNEFFGYCPACFEYDIVQDIGAGYYIHINVTTYDITEDMDTVLGRVLLLEGDYTINE